MHGSFLKVLKRPCHGRLVSFVIDASYASFVAIELEKLPFNERMTASCQGKCLLSFTSNVTNNRMNFEKRFYIYIFLFIWFLHTLHKTENFNLIYLLILCPLWLLLFVSFAFKNFLTLKTCFQKHQLQSVSIFFEFVHPCLLFYLLCYLYLRLMFCAVIFMFHSFWWGFPLFEF